MIVSNKQLESQIVAFAAYLDGINNWRSHLEVLRIRQTMLLFTPQKNATKSFIELLGSTQYSDLVVYFDLNTHEVGLT